ncbi:hypothetical protein [Streptomyces sp. NPDC007074]|uniref:hypothetical protein n=1 Tax=Streptomyces sp. NPDC007074 TaxID=3156764 RepID=UPI0033FA9793
MNNWRSGGGCCHRELVTGSSGGDLTDGPAQAPAADTEPERGRTCVPGFPLCVYRAAHGAAPRMAPRRAWRRAAHGVAHGAAFGAAHGAAFGVAHGAAFGVAHGAAYRTAYVVGAARNLPRDTAFPLGSGLCPRAAGRLKSPRCRRRSGGRSGPGAHRRDPCP